MPEPLKNMYNRSFIEQFAAQCAAVIKNFDGQQFLSNFFTPQWEAMELKQRVRHIAQALAGQLSGKYPADVKSVVKLAKHIMASGVINTFQHIILADYIEVYGLEHPDESLDAMETITILSSGEFAIRPFIVRYPDKVMARMLQWTQHPHASVRRLASEGCRPRLPWGMALVAFKKDPSPVLPILEALKNDPSEYVRRSVANNLNDIAKDHPGLVKDIANRWKGISPETDKILKHGTRTLLKKSDGDALSLFGIKPINSVTVSNLSTAEKAVRIGDHLSFSYTLHHREKAPELIRMEYVVDYLKANGSHNRKVFKISEGVLEPGKEHKILRRQSFRNMTTRVHYPGQHKLAIVVNGKEYASVRFEVLA